MTTNKTSTQDISCSHSNFWDLQTPIIDDGLSVTFDGICTQCGKEFQVTYDNPKFTIINPQTQEPLNYEKELIV